MPMAQAGLSVSTPNARSQAGNFLRVVSPAELDDRDRADLARRSAAARPPELDTQDIGAWVRQQWMVFRNHRNLGSNSMNERLLRCQRMFEAKYDPIKLQEIQNFGGSEVYARVVAAKTRGATSLLRDIYLSPDRPWDIQPQPDPPLPPDVQANIIQLIGAEVNTLRQAGQPVVEDQVHMRYLGLIHAAQAAAQRNAMMQATAASNKIEDILVAGDFYNALGEFLLDLPLFPFACLKGPVVRMVPKLTWVQGQPIKMAKPQMFWERVNPFNIYWSPGASRIDKADIIERLRLTRSDLNELIGLPGYDENAVRGALVDYNNGLREWLDYPDPEQAINEGREDPSLNRSMYIDAIMYAGRMQGQLLLDNGVEARLIPDPGRDYLVTSFVCGRYTLKTQISPSPTQRHPYFITSFEKIPGTIAGHALPDLLEDIQEVTNATYRSLVNNLAISSGPQVVVNDEMVSPTERSDEMHPWKRWHVQGDPMGNQRDPISFFQPQSNAGELLQVIQAMQTMADEISAIPRYLTGESLSGGAGRTSSGLAMLMNNAQKVLQTVAANIDTDVMSPLLEHLYEMIMLTDTTGILTGEEEIRVRGTAVAIQRETERNKQLQFLQITANPIDAPIVGQIGRARVLRAVAQGLGLPDDVVPDDQTLQAQIDAQKRMQAAGQALVAQSHQGGEPPAGAQQGGQQGTPNQSGAPTAPAGGGGASGSSPAPSLPGGPGAAAPPVNSFAQGVPT